VLNQLHNIYVTDPNRVLQAAESITQGVNTNPFPDISASILLQKKHITLLSKSTSEK